MASTTYPKANTTAQWYENTYPGSVMGLAAPVLVLHTMEGTGWPGYSGGSMAPTFSIRPGVGVRQHFPVNRSARALKNLAGGVQTNTQGAIQIELEGTCATNGPGIYWPNATDSQMAELVDLVAWLHTEWGLKLQSSVRWVAYPGSYGQNASQRLSGAQWTAYEGILGHQHVPENEHGDPGAFPIQRLLALVNAKLGTGTTTTTTTTTTNTPTPVHTTNVAPILPNGATVSLWQINHQKAANQHTATAQTLVQRWSKANAAVADMPDTCITGTNDPAWRRWISQLQPRLGRKATGILDADDLHYLCTKFAGGNGWKDGQ